MRVDAERIKINLDLFSLELTSNGMEILNNIPEQKVFCSVKYEATRKK